MSHGPLIGGPEMVVATAPERSRTIRHPACIVADVPFLLGRLPTTTQPLLSATSAVVSPTPPGHDPGSRLASISANWVTDPPGDISTMVVPAPCRLRGLLKLLTRTSPAPSRPTLAGTPARPAGLKAPSF